MSFTYEYERPAVTTDIVVIAMSADPRVLLVERGGPPFAGSLALPGGFLDPGEGVRQGAVRELAEETRLAFGSPLLNGVLLHPAGVHGTPGRDPRGWVVSVAYAALVTPAVMQAAVAGDDARAVHWVRLAEVLTTRLAFDHNEIVRDALAGLSAGLAVTRDLLRFLPESFQPADYEHLMRGFEAAAPGQWSQLIPSLIARGYLEVKGPLHGKPLAYKQRLL